MEKAFWMGMLICMVLIFMYAGYKSKGMDYTAGQGFFKKSGYSIPEDNKQEFEDYSPYDYDDLRK